MNTTHVERANQKTILVTDYDAMKYVIYNPTYNLYAGELKGFGFKSYRTIEEAHHFNNKETAETISSLLSVAVYSSACRVLEVNAD